MKALYDRAAYALIAAFAGALMGALLWWLYGLGMSSRPTAIHVQGSLASWMKVAAGLFGLVGFAVKDRAGEAIGATISQVFELERSPYSDAEIPTWAVVVVLGVVVAGVWFAVRA